MKRILFLCRPVVVILYGLLVATTGYAESLPEYKMKAAFLYNFVQLAEWPKSSEEQLRLCVDGQDPIVDALREIEGYEVNGKHIKIVLLSNSSAGAGCDTLYLGESADVKSMLNKLGESSVLTVSDSIDSEKSGVIISMFPMGRRLVFSVNAESAKRAHLTLSSKLLRLAKHVD